MTPDLPDIDQQPFFYFSQPKSVERRLAGTMLDKSYPPYNLRILLMNFRYLHHSTTWTMICVHEEIG